MLNNWHKTTPNGFLLTGLIVVSLAASGCASRGGILGVDCCADVPAGAVPQQAGAKLCDWQTAQVGGAVADQTMLYRSDFIGTSTTLSPGAIERMARNANSGLAGMQPAMIEPSGDASLDAARVNSVNRQLVSFGVTAPTTEIATPAALGMRGPLAERVASGFGGTRNSSAGTGAPISQTSGLGSQSGSFGGNLPGGIF
ncbi:hypothetical protein Enr13x_57590 [Stieleria neptunia]|uniref:Lipoprotein n=1 Tax=Stieleria neptunia TaxID=2527979 RepID=A0A518HYC5_9BACT|nr:hypothetical protein [Stieleria neptunia]QDV45856.1 hypothetical protein Enr13x_57590 [Stieleria neptunia]